MIRSVEARSGFPFVLLAIILATPKPAHAYVDPGGGAMLWQIAAAGVIGSLWQVSTHPSAEDVTKKYVEFPHALPLNAPGKVMKNELK